MEDQDRYDSLIVFYSKKWGRIAKQIKRQIRIESAFNPRAKNKTSGAMGLMQFMPRTWEEWVDGTAGIQPPPPGVTLKGPYDPETNINAGCAYMAALERQFGRLDYALAAYNWGPGNLKKLLKKLQPGQKWTDRLPAETRNYVAKGLRFNEETLVV